jgi:hypothetical protein
MAPGYEDARKLKESKESPEYWAKQKSGDTTRVA